MMKLIFCCLLILHLLGCSGKGDKNTVDLNGGEIQQFSPEKQVEVKKDVLASQSSTEPLEGGEYPLKEEDFGPVIELQGTPWPTEDIFLIKESELLIKGRYLMQKTLPLLDMPVLNVFSMPELSLKKGLGRMGQGPGEFMYPSLVSTDEPDKLCYLFEATTRQFYYLDTELRLKKASYQPPIEHGGMSEAQIHCLSDREWIYYLPKIVHEGVLWARVSEKGQLEKRQLFDPVFSDRFRSYAAVRGHLAVSGKHRRFVYAYTLFRRIVFGELDGPNTRVLSSNFAEPRNKKDFFDPKNTVHFWKISPGLDHVFVSYSGRAPVQVHNENKADKGYIMIEQYTWAGKAVRKFRLDRWGWFVVDEKSNKIIVVCYYSDDPFFVYHLPPLNPKTDL